ncbi:DUF2490 domain-containing protein [uncultured Eudoraea sp.]|uniref:DUF2490 domain-containing protein n=1 Tax=uncultured Eudoraea sp. TaxID=1035614 RepID=UPI00262464A8|nr:DUF2490 domain-containing protein [uncultured Eudoraea sp.]
MIRNRLKNLFLILFFLPVWIYAQTTEEPPTKNVNQQSQTWISLNSVFQLTKHWSGLADFHMRRSNFVKNPSFNFIRFGARYGFNNNLKLSAGYAHLWLAKDENWTLYLNENRIYQEFILADTWSTFSGLFRIRTEQRFFNNVEEGQSLQDDFFINRIRFLLSITIPFKKDGKTSFLVANEVHLNFGKEVVFNTFDQNRFTVGIKQKLSKTWSFDFGYMMVYQQLPSGIDYNLNHTIRLFFYSNFDLRKNKEEQIRHGQTID